MHELSLALEVCRIAETYLEPGAAPRLRAIGVEVGDESNVERENLRFCLEALLDAPPFAGAVPTIVPCAGTDLRLAYLEVDDGCPDN
jgi:Zn finger protein HypA/HybF involved in hydrogenase expression